MKKKDKIFNLKLLSLFIAIAIMVFSCSKDDEVEHPKYGTVLNEDCSGTTQIIQYADGKGGYTTSSVENSDGCGYVPPVGGTFSGQPILIIILQ
ncbi:hypothetical protein [Thalassobellus suaedae]|uniref:Uncharacterized protein n=1 Tax=Thalassobellus suaedae TaxID=3074124 RepID=A0ABY9XTM0_9FLAO|nr:hypothetical protein RHP51_00545 [Flavobacteriaceae bacterium HL-DH14]